MMPSKPLHRAARVPHAIERREKPDFQPGRRLFVGIGSSHGDDAAGWQVAAALRAIVGRGAAGGPCASRCADQGTSHGANAEVAGGPWAIREAASPSELLNWLDGVARLDICDASQPTGRPGRVVRLEWPSPAIAHVAPRMRHDLPLADVLRLAATLGQLPREVIVWVVEAAALAPGAAQTPAVVNAIEPLAARIADEWRRQHAPPLLDDAAESARATHGDQPAAHRDQRAVHPDQPAAHRYQLAGQVQGIGLRPAVAALATRLQLAGSIANTAAGVAIHVEGARSALSQFERQLRAALPEAASLESFVQEPAAPRGAAKFVIAVEPLAVGGSTSQDELAPPAVRVPTDVAACTACLEEIGDRGNRRFEHALSSCTRCGPRYSIIESLPYDRRRTSMHPFAMCPACRREYAADDRRFHAQTIACPDCGPQLAALDRQGRTVATGPAALQAAAAALRTGQILALRGLGGYQLVVDATDRSAVARVRDFKRRPVKPLAVMVASLADAQRWAQLDATACAALTSPAAPIVVVPTRGQRPWVSDVHPGLGEVGLFLPTTPLHALLLAAVGRPLVVTSGNREGEPLACRAATARAELSAGVDCWLEHNRPIVRPIDDSVVRPIAGRAVTLRLARGLAPLSLAVDVEACPPLVALGGQQKAALAVANTRQAALGPHIGDLQTAAARARFVEQVDSLAALYGVTPAVLVHDLHPDYFTTHYAAEAGCATFAVQHHHAHVAAALIETGWLDRPVLGVALDGTGYGPDGTVWGGEFLLASAATFRRVARLRPFPLVGGEAAVRQPWRVAVALAVASLSREAARGLTLGDVPAGSIRLVAHLAAAREARDAPTALDARAASVVPTASIATIDTSSAGRLFDGVAALALGVTEAAYEGHPAILLEAAADPTAGGAYRFGFYHPRRDGAPAELDWRPLVRALWADRQRGVPPATIAMRFHRGLADAIARVCRRFAEYAVVLVGGVFQNRLLVELVADRLEGRRQPVALPGRMPPNDGGLAAGQLAVATAQWTRTQPAGWREPAQRAGREVSHRHIPSS